VNRYVLGFAFVGEDVLLIHKLRGPSVVRNKLNGIGGNIEVGETPLNAMVREFKEETDIDTTLRQWNYKALMSVPAYQANIYVYSTKFVAPIAHKSMTDEIVSWYWMHNRALNIVDNLKWLLPLAFDDNVYFAGVTDLTPGKK